MGLKQGAVSLWRVSRSAVVKNVHAMARGICPGNAVEFSSVDFSSPFATANAA